MLSLTGNKLRRKLILNIPFEFKLSVNAGIIMQLDEMVMVVKHVLPQ